MMFGRNKKGISYYLLLVFVVVILLFLIIIFLVSPASESIDKNSKYQDLAKEIDTQILISDHLDFFIQTQIERELSIVKSELIKDIEINNKLNLNCIHDGTSIWHSESSKNILCESNFNSIEKDFIDKLTKNLNEDFDFLKEDYDLTFELVIDYDQINQLYTIVIKTNYNYVSEISNFKKEKEFSYVFGNDNYYNLLGYLSNKNTYENLRNNFFECTVNNVEEVNLCVNSIFEDSLNDDFFFNYNFEVLSVSSENGIYQIKFNVDPLNELENEFDFFIEYDFSKDLENLNSI